MKLNTGSTTSERIRIVLGTLLAFAGIFILIVIGGISGYNDMQSWIIGIIFLLAGIFLAGSRQLVTIVSDFIRF